jgi:hypothetical protein
MQLVDPVPEKKRKRQVLDYILMPPLPKAVRSPITIHRDKTRKPSISQAQRNGKQKERIENPPVVVEIVCPAFLSNASLSCA